ncbi:MAG: TetR/AcrR family transcriptional regulator [Deltaproteobacteria bacterium]|nr:MAG: TetR/AcrR family transcriptional regulator [Deltaproteobacteria bacterium]
MKRTKPERLEPRKTPRQRRARATVDDLLEAAAQVFDALGYAAGTTNRIAERAGVSIGTLYQYFPSKEALAVALLERHLEDGMRRLNAWVGRAVAESRSLRGTLELFVAGMIALHDERPRLQHILLEETPLPARVHDALLAAERAAAEQVAELLRRYPEVRHPRLAEAAVMAVQTVEHLTHRFAAHPGQGLPRDAFAAELVRMLEAYLTRAEP